MSLLAGVLAGTGLVIWQGAFSIVPAVLCLAFAVTAQIASNFANEIVRRYNPLLEPLGLTYTQYIAMMVMWEHKFISVKEMGKLLLLGSGRFMFKTLR